MPKLLDRIKGMFGVTFGGSDPSTWQFAQDWLRGLFPRGGLIEEPYRQHGTVAVAISAIAEDAASVEWELFRKQGETITDDVVENHPVQRLWDRPNDTMVAGQLWTGTYLSYQLFGEAFWYYPDVRLARGSSTALARMSEGGLSILDPRKVKGKITSSGVEWTLVVNNVEERLDRDRLTQFRRLNPYNPIRGLSKIEAVLMEIGGDYAAAQWNERFFSSQNGIPSGLLVPSTGTMLSADQRRDMLMQWNQKHRGTKRSIGIIPAGWSFQDLGINQRDMDFKGLREYSREQILGMFGVPPFIAGVLDKANYANAREQKEVYWHGTITRFLTGIASSLNHDFLPKVGVTDVEAFPRWETVKALTEDFSEKVETAERLWKMGVPFEQINARLEMGFDPGEIPGGDVGYLPMNLMPVDLIGEPLTVAGPVDEPVTETETETRRLSPVRRGLPAIDTAREKRRTLVWKNVVARTRDLEFTFSRVIRAHFREIEKEVLANINGLKGWLFAQKQQEPRLFDLDEAKKKLVKRTAPAHRAALARGGESILADVLIEASFDLLNPQVLAKLAEMSGKITRIDETVERVLRSSLIEGVGQGETVDELATRVRSVMAASKSRAATIARTEVGFAFNAGRNLAMKQAGIDRHEWLSSRDPDVRDSHTAEDGNVTQIGEPFPVTGLLYPQDNSGPPSEVINCRCVALPVVEG